MANKMTKKEIVTAMLEDEYITSSDIFKGYLENELKLLNKKSSSRGSTKNQKENEDIKNVILNVLADNGEPMTVTEILRTGDFDSFEKTITNQKITALLRQLILAEKVTKTVEKKVSRFSLR